MQPKAFVFDLDGTLLDTLLDIAGAANEILQSFHFRTHPVDAYNHFVGDGAEKLFERILPPEQNTPEMIRRCVIEFEAVYARHWRRNTKIYPGVQAVIEELKQQENPLTVLSNKMDVFTKLMVAEYFDPSTFQIVLGAREGVPKKPHPNAALEIAQQLRISPDHIVFVGDTSTDMKTAVSAKMFPLGVLWGFRDEAELRKTGARAIISQPQELMPLFFR